MTESQALTIGTTLKGKSYTYTINKVLGQGSFGITYLATTRVKIAGPLGELETAIRVAIKEFFMKNVNGRAGNTVTFGSEEGVCYNYKKQFIREATNLSKFNHPHIVKVLEAFEANNTAYFVMEFIEGGSLNDYIQANGSLSDKEALKTVIQIGEALSVMHRNNMLHLDLKPLNVMRRLDGELVLIDFGLSKQFDEYGEPESSTHIGCGTRGYAPIEQINYKRGNSFPATLDIYALGATLFKALTGITPPEASEIFNDGFPQSDMVKKGIEDSLIRLTSWAMEPMKSKRPQTVGEFLSEAKRLLRFASDQPHQQTSFQSVGMGDNRHTMPFNQEVCNGLEIHWADKLPEDKKEEIRRLIEAMEKIGYKDQGVYTDYGYETVASYPLMSLGDMTWHYIYPLTQNESTVGCPPRRSLSTALSLTLALEHWTGLPFRIAAEDELRFIHTEEPSITDEMLVTYSPQKGLQFKNYKSGEYIDIPSLLEDKIVNFQLVCDRSSPIWKGDSFDIPYTQRLADEILPIGFGLYKIRIGTDWNITSPISPMSSYLPEDYESITCINTHHIPGGGPTCGYDYIGIQATKGDITSYYEFSKHKFDLLDSLSKKEIEERKTWT